MAKEQNLKAAEDIFETSCAKKDNALENHENKHFSNTLKHQIKVKFV